ncbi:hypothetical protein ZIOFF_037129 [Zingiber officinale]|uniref:Fatty acid desaturase domain-containing protein n=1 Tax=Zingiber officinale TaxID=94328 RepID=A0A8J5GRK0_ZINOF|nr:hypothetical protein ZIOFF_037129 [Zingiber officinale]
MSSPVNFLDFSVRHSGLDSLAVRRSFLCHHSFSQKVSYRVRAAAVTASPTFLDNAEERKLLAEKYGFMQIGKPLPNNITMKDIMDTLPKKLFEIDDMKPWRSVLISVTSYALGIFMIAKAPWYLLPLAWAWTGTAITGVGFFTCLACFDYYVLSEDTAWNPVMRDEFESSPLMRKAIIYGYGPLKTWMSITHWLIWHFNLKKFRPAEIGRVKISLACVFAFMAIGWPLIIYKTGITGWIKFWLMPWLGYHFWMSTFTMVHHTAPHIPFKTSDEWHAAQAQLNGTVHCNYPRWIEILCHDINVHIPHHISSRIPSYNLREAHKVLQDNWGEYLNEANWNWRLMKTILTVCHVYDHERYYVPFDEIAPDESYPIQFLKETMPDYA